MLASLFALFQHLDPRRSLRMRVAWIVAGSGVLLAALSAQVVERTMRAELEDSVGHTLRREALLAGQALATLLHEPLRLLTQLAGHPRLASGTMPPGDQRALLETLREQQPEISWLAVVDRHGVVQVATQALLEGEDLSDESWFRPGLSRPWLGERHVQGRLKGPFGLTQGTINPEFIDLAAPLIDPKGQTFGVLVAQVDWDWVSQVHARVRPSVPEDKDPTHRSVETLLVGRAGQIDLGPAELVGRPLGVPELNAATDLRPQLLTWPDGQRYLGVAVTVPVPGQSRALRVVARQTEASAFASVERLRWQLFGVGFLLTALFVGVSLWLAHRVTAPVRALADIARRRQQGEVVGFGEVQGEGSEELRGLAIALHDMDGALQRVSKERLQSEQQYRAMFDGSPDAHLVIEKDRITLANSSCLALLGAKSVSELSERGLWGLVHPDDHEALNRRRQQLREGATVLAPVEERLLSMTGAVVEVETSALVLSGPGEPRLHVVMRDITERKRASQALARSEALFQTAMRGTAAGVWDWDLKRSEVYYTETWRDLLGVPRAQLPRSVGDWGPWLQPPDRDRVLGLLRGMAQGEPEQIDTELQLKHHDGHDVVLLARAFLLRDEQGRPDRIIGTVLDVTERHRDKAMLLQLKADLEQRVEQRTADLRRANVELDSYARTVSHDLRQYLIQTTGLLQMQRQQARAALQAADLRFLDLAEDKLRQALSQMQALLDLSKLDREALRPQWVPVTLFAQRLHESLSELYPTRQVTLETAPDLRVWGDPNLVQALLQNLLSNAWKYTSQQAQARIWVDQVSEDGRCWTRVRDDGVGFDPAQADKLGQPFSRLHPSSQFAGHGVGLATVARIVERHGGQWRAEGRPGEGACFSFALPEPPFVDA